MPVTGLENKSTMHTQELKRLILYASTTAHTDTRYTVNVTLSMLHCQCYTDKVTLSMLH